MLETLPRVSVAQDVHRFANLSHVAHLAVKKGLTIAEIAQVIAFNRDDVTKELMEGPFQRKVFFGNKFGKRSRFSDGEWPVFYGAIGRMTAQKESAYHYGRKAAGDAVARRGVHYSIVRCRFSGEIVDLQPKLPVWPDLIDDDYTFCNGLGKEARDGGLGGFLAPSARNLGGTTVPAFMARTLLDPTIEAAVKLTFDDGDIALEVKEMS
jgi:hypothetical protein